MILQRFTDTVLCQLISLRYKQEFGSHLSKYIKSKNTYLLQKQRELYKELKNNNNTLASYYIDYARIMSRVIREAKITENDQLILNSHNKVKTTWGIINKESGKYKKRSETQALNIEGKKVTDQQTIVDTFNEYFITIAENVKRQIKNNFINDDTNIMVSHTRFMEQAFTNPYPSMKWKNTTTEEIERIIKIPQN
jgi:hypothetical protein